MSWTGEGQGPEQDREQDTRQHIYVLACVLALRVRAARAMRAADVRALRALYGAQRHTHNTYMCCVAAPCCGALRPCGPAALALRFTGSAPLLGTASHAVLHCPHRRTG